MGISSNNAHYPVQAFITNISFPTSLDELLLYSNRFNMENVLGCMMESEIDDEAFGSTSWTAPKWAKEGDIVFFFHAKTANAKISALRTELKKEKDEYDPQIYWYLLNCLNRAKAIWNEYGGKIFAVGHISGNTYYEDREEDEDYHWKSRIYAPIDDIFVLEHPIDISEFNNQFAISRHSATTPVFGENFEYLKTLICKKNKDVRQYFIDAVSQPVPFTQITDENWLDVLNQYRRSFIYEAQFRAFYVDRLLRELGDQKKFYAECLCRRAGFHDTWVDNIILFNGKYLPIECKLSVAAEANIQTQLDQYVKADAVLIESDRDIKPKIWTDSVLIIDTESIYTYDPVTRSLAEMMPLDEIHTTDDITTLRHQIKSYLGAKH